MLRDLIKLVLKFQASEAFCNPGPGTSYVVVRLLGERWQITECGGEVTGAFKLTITKKLVKFSPRRWNFMVKNRDAELRFEVHWFANS